jgi:hypothetical protein
MCHDVIHDVSHEMAEDEKKERVIHTRVPESLEAELRRRAQDLGISVSNLVRNVLGHAFGLVGDVVADSHAIARAARGETRRKDVVAWQEIVAAKEMACPSCSKPIAKGARAAIPVHDDGTNGTIECADCASRDKDTP